MNLNLKKDNTQKMLSFHTFCYALPFIAMVLVGVTCSKVTNKVNPEHYIYTLRADDEQWRYSKSVSNINSKNIKVPDELKGITQYKGPIDIVFTWLDANDPVWQASFKSYGLTYDPERFTSSREVDINLASLSVYFPNCGKIYIVSEQQMDLGYLPESFRQKISFVRHREIIDKQYLPTFSANVLEANLWKIPGLSEIFMYLNDDVFLMQPFDVDRIINAGPQLIVPSTYVPRWCVPEMLKAESFPEAHTIDYTNTFNLFMNKFGYCIPYINDDHRPYILSVSLNRYTTKLYPEAVHEQNKNRIRNYASYKKGGDFIFLYLSLYIGEYYDLIKFSSNFTSFYAIGFGDSVHNYLKGAFSKRPSIDFMTIQDMPQITDEQFEYHCTYSLLKNPCDRNNHTASFCKYEICKNRRASLYGDKILDAVTQYTDWYESYLIYFIALIGLGFLFQKKNVLKGWLITSILSCLRWLQSDNSNVRM